MKQRLRTKGFSLVEILIVLGIVTLLMGIVTLLLRDTFKFNRNISDSLTQNLEARHAIKRMSAEIRILSPSSIGAYPLEQAGTSTLTFYSNVDTDPEKERVRYFIKNNALIRGEIQPTGNPLTYNQATEATTTIVRALINNSSTPLFSYHTDAYAGTSSPLVAPFTISIVRLIKIAIYTQNDSATTSPNIYTTQVSFRNLKDNL